VRTLTGFLGDLLWIELLLKQDFTTLGAARLSQDVYAIEHLALDKPAAMVKLRQGILLLNLPLRSEEGSAITLIEASAAVYATNSQADEILRRLALDQLSRSDARDILARRVEVRE
jgi:hypothetical protein